jgi:lysozyme
MAAIAQDISTKGLIEIMSHEGVCLSPYLDSVGVWTIGVGITKYDGVSPKDMAPITMDQAITMFKARIRAYVLPVQKLNLNLNQHQFDALVSFCFNCGPGNLAKLTKGRSVNAIGTALMLYTKPKEITARRQKEQKLYQFGTYSSNGKVLVFPVNAKHKPVYSKGVTVDALHYLQKAEPAVQAPQAVVAPTPTPVAVEPTIEQSWLDVDILPGEARLSLRDIITQFA